MSDRSKSSPANLPVPVGSPAEAETPRASRRAGFASFAAQLLGQPGRKRGLKGGPPVLEEARAAYLEAEYSGPADRRARTGRIAKKEV